MRFSLSRLTLALALPVSLLAFSSAVRATSIGINVNSGDAATMLNPGDVAGASSVAQDNWNNTINSWTSSGSTITGLVNSAGAATPVGVNWQAGANWQDGEGASWGFSGGNLTMMTGNLALGQNNITISNIPYSSYNVYVYMGEGDNGGVGEASIANAGATGSVDPNTYYYSYGWESGNWVQANGTTLASATGGSSPGNYVEFGNNSAPSITVSQIDPSYTDQNGGTDWYGGWSGVAGIEIVNTGIDLSAVPEPASVSLLVVGGVACLLRRRRKA